MVKHGLRPGTLKSRLFNILPNKINNGMKVPDLAMCVQISELNPDGTIEEPEFLNIFCSLKWHYFIWKDF